MRSFTRINLILLHPFQTERIAHLSGRFCTRLRPRPYPGLCGNSVNPLEPIMRDPAPPKGAEKRFRRETMNCLLLLIVFLYSLPSQAESPERLRLVGAVPSGFEQTLQLNFSLFKVDEYTASGSHKLVRNTHIRLEQRLESLPLDLAGTLKHYESTNMARCQAPELTTIFSGVEQGMKPTSCLRSVLSSRILIPVICDLPRPFWLMLCISSKSNSRCLNSVQIKPEPFTRPSCFGLIC
jgi:hypothetical protein